MPKLAAGALARVEFAWSDLEKRLGQSLFRLDPAGRRRLWVKLAKMISNGIQLVQAIDGLRERRIAAGAKAHPQTAALAAWAAAMRNGASLARAIEGWTSTEEAMLIAAGEQSGTLERALHSCAQVMAARARITGAVAGGLAYPFVLLAMAFALMYLFGFKIVPAFQHAIPPGSTASWHGLAAAMIEASDFVRHWILEIVLAFVGVATAFFVSLPRFDGPVRVVLDRYTPYNVYRILQGSTWLIAIASLVEAGLRIETALESLAAKASPWLRRRLRTCLAAMRSGQNLGEALGSSGDGFPDQEIIDDMSVYASLSGFDAALALLGREWLDESVERIAGKMKVVFGVAMLGVGSLIAFMVGGMMNMELQMSQILQHMTR